MKLTRCSNGHFYDADKYSECPQCEDGTIPANTPEGFGGDVTVPLSPNGKYYCNRVDDFDDITQPLTEITAGGTMPPWNGGNTVPTDCDDCTIPVWVIESDNSTTKANVTTPAVGWLICLEGKYKGCDFRLQAGKNTIGRNETNSICLSGDLSISREPQVIVAYEPKLNRFFALPGPAKELAYVNNDVLLERVDLHKNDLIELGKTKLMLIPCCDDKFSWNEILKK